MIWVHGSDCQDGHARGGVLWYSGVVEWLCERGRVVVDIKNSNIHQRSVSVVGIVDFDGLCVGEGGGRREGGGEGGRGGRGERRGRNRGEGEERRWRKGERVSQPCTMTVSVYTAVLSRSRLVTFTKITPVVELMSKLGSPPRAAFPETIKYVTDSLSPKSWSLASTWMTLSP